MTEMLIRSSADVLAELPAKRTEYAEARIATMARKLELTAAHERLIGAQQHEMDLTREVEALEKALLECVEKEALIMAEQQAEKGDN